MKKKRLDHLIKVKQELDAMSPSICLAKWVQVTLHLQTGRTHSCHHPTPHNIPIECIDNPTLLHNTPEKKKMRQQMLIGEKPKECEYCWAMERSSSLMSDRITKSSEDWAYPHLNKIINSSPDTNFIPTYLELNFKNTCNMKCIYCDPYISSTWYKEIEKYGAYPTSPDYNSITRPIHLITKNNPYLKAFWKWWPEVYPKLHTLRITGGEPLLHKELYNLLDFLIEHPRKIDLAINTNMCVPSKLMNRFIKKLEKLQDKVKRIIIYTSCEAKGEKAEYIRHGLNYNAFWKGIDTLLKLPKVYVTIMSTYNILSVSSYTDFLKDVYERKFYKKERIIVDTPFLRNPKFLNARILTKDFIKYVIDSCTYLFEHQESSEWYKTAGKGFFNQEAIKFKRIFHILETVKENTYTNKQRKNFYIFIKELDHRRGTSFKKTFPEYENFLNICKRG